jgi:hypothetical protein
LNSFGPSIQILVFGPKTLSQPSCQAGPFGRTDPFGPSPGAVFHLLPRAVAARPAGCRRSARRRSSPSRTRMEPNQTAARPPSLSRTSSAPHRLPSPIQCRNRWVKIHCRRSPPSPHLASRDPIKGAAHHPLLPHNPLPHSSSFLSVPSFMFTRRSRRRFASSLSASLRYRTVP